MIRSCPDFQDTYEGVKLEIAVCVKRVAEASEAEFTIDERGGLKAKGLAYDLNEWDEYALEEALRIKEAHGGRVTAFTVGGQEDEGVLRKCLAKGADEAVRIDVPAPNDPYVVAKLLYAALSQGSFHLILTGAQAGDDGYAAVPAILASLLNIPFAALVKRLEIRNGVAIAHRELEGGLEEVVELSLPALFSIQTGINEPRYVSVMGLRMASKKPLRVVKVDELRDRLKELGGVEGYLKVSGYEIPMPERRAELIEGPADRAAATILKILRERGVVV